MNQFLALLHKNWVLFRRGWIGSFLELTIPITLFCIILIIRNMVPIEKYQQQQYLGNRTLTIPFTSNISQPLQNIHYLKNCSNEVVALVPADDPMVLLLNTKLMNAGYKTELYQSNEEVNEIIKSFDYGEGQKQKFCFGVTFQKSEGDYKYEIRDSITSGILDPREKLTNDGAVDLLTYFQTIYSGMVGTTMIVNSLIFERETNHTDLNLVNIMAPIYQQQNIQDSMYNFLGSSLGTIILLPLILVFTRQVMFMVMEKEKKIKQNMIIMGMKIQYYYITWFIRYFLAYFVIHVVGTGWIVGTLPSIPYQIPFLIFILFDIVLVLQAAIVQFPFKRTIYGVISACLVFALQSSIIGIIAEPDAPSEQLFMGVSTIPHVAVALAFKELLYADSKQLKVDFPSNINYYTINTCIVSLILNIVLLIIILVLLQVKWGFKIGHKNKSNDEIYFEGTKEQILQAKMENQENQAEDMRVSFKMEQKAPKYNSAIEQFSDEGRIEDKLIVQKLYKKFGQTKAVAGLNLALLKNEIYVLLGHNGAGKTTSISMITGLLQPTSGHISILGETDESQIIKVVGVCPQENPLFDDLTIYEHIRLYASFKGISGEELENEIDKLIAEVGLEEKRDKPAASISGGQKRKLSIAMAFCGNSKVIILDEPTAGIDTSARRQIWDILKKYRNDRIILLTTHLMYEAEYLGDKIGIMVEGKLAAEGTNFHLKNKFGIGYIFTFVKDMDAEVDDKIIQTIRQFIPQSKIISSASGQLKVQLPLSYTKRFGKMCDKLDENKKKLGIKSYGVSVTSLEEIFLQVGSKKKISHFNSMSYISEKEQQQQLVRVTGFCYTFCSHLLATILKRIRVTKKDKKSILFQLILPIIFIILGLLLMTSLTAEEIDAQELSYELYLSEGEVKVPIATEQNEDFIGDLKAAMERRYGNSFNISTFIEQTDQDFDKNVLFSIKMQEKQFNLKGGIFFNEYEDTESLDDDQIPDYLKSVSNRQINKVGNFSTSNSTNGTEQWLFSPFTTIINTKSPTTLITVQTLATETYMNYLTNETSSIVVVNNPFPKSRLDVHEKSVGSIVQSTFGVGIFSVALAFKFASIAYFLTKQRESGSKDQQLMSGLLKSSYWMGNFLYDFISYSIIAAFGIGMCFILQIRDFIGDQESTSAFCALFFLYGFTNTFFTYVFCFLFSEAFHAQVGIFFFNFFNGGVITVVLILIKAILKEEEIVPLWIFRVFPAFAFGEGVANLGGREILSFFLKNRKFQPFDLNIALAPIIYLGCIGVIFLLMLIVIEIISSKRICPLCLSQGKKQNSDKVAEIRAEERAAQEANPSDYPVLIRNLYKSFDQKIAVNDVSFRVNKGQIFGLLGANGAGKSTTFKMLTGDLKPNQGQIFFEGQQLNQNFSSIIRNVGYCPQTNPLIDYLSVQEQLELFYDLKCLPPDCKDQVIFQLIEKVNLNEFAETLSGKLSGGNKRKLSLAIAILGNPDIILLDEPSTGMDPKAKRFMWKIIAEISLKKKQSTVILTTHSMDEAEALSTRLAIMIEGNFRCIGTPQEIKSKYGKGYEIEVKIKKSQQNLIETAKRKYSKKGFQDEQIGNQNISKFYDKLIPEFKQYIKKELDKNGGYLSIQLSEGRTVHIDKLFDFCIQKKRMKKFFQLLETEGSVQTIETIQFYARYKLETQKNIGSLFNFIEEHKEKYHIEQYSVNQATVEQIFNDLTHEKPRSMIFID